MGIVVSDVIFNFILAGKHEKSVISWHFLYLWPNWVVYEFVHEITMGSWKNIRFFFNPWLTDVLLGQSQLDPSLKVFCEKKLYVKLFCWSQTVLLWKWLRAVAMEVNDSLIGPCGNVIYFPVLTNSCFTHHMHTKGYLGTLCFRTHARENIFCRFSQIKRK